MQTRVMSSKYVGKMVEVLCEGVDEKTQKYLGRDEYGRMVYFDSPTPVIGEFLTVRIDKANGISLFGEVTGD